VTIKLLVNSYSYNQEYQLFVVERKACASVDIFWLVFDVPFNNYDKKIEKETGLQYGDS
jgi:hypothetical protein